MNDNVIEVKNLSKRFKIGMRERMTLFSTLRYSLSGELPTKEFWALKNVSFSVKKGELIAIIGPNGAGKTTLLRILAGIMTPTSGDFIVRDDISCIFELGLGFDPRLTALENMYIYGALHGMSRQEIDAKVPEIIEFSELSAFMGAKLGEFSSGMRARLAFATVIHTLGGVVMIDEVLSVGDASFRQKCVKAMENIISNGHTILFISHGLGDIKNIVSKALYLEGGELIKYGGLKEVEELYASRTQQKYAATERTAAKGE